MLCLHVCMLDTAVSHAKAAELAWAQVTVYLTGFTVAPPGQCDGLIFVAAVMWLLATCSVAACYSAPDRGAEYCDEHVWNYMSDLHQIFCACYL